ncbi:hypothetical protein HN51_000414 [Arachis hypogaea]
MTKASMVLPCLLFLFLLASQSVSHLLHQGLAYLDALVDIAVAFAHHQNQESDLYNIFNHIY